MSWASHLRSRPRGSIGSLEHSSISATDRKGPSSSSGAAALHVNPRPCRWNDPNLTMLPRHGAAASGTEVREGWTVSKFTQAGETVTLEAHDESGRSECFEAPFLIDASGRGNLTGNQEGLRMVHPRLKKLAVFGHFSGVKLDDDESGGDTVIVRLVNKWFWIIPLSREKVSVGCVMDQ